MLRVSGAGVRSSGVGGWGLGESRFFGRGLRMWGLFVLGFGVWGCLWMHLGGLVGFLAFGDRCYS